MEGGLDRSSVLLETFEGIKSAVASNKGKFVGIGLAIFAIYQSFVILSSMIIAWQAGTGWLPNLFTVNMNLFSQIAIFSGQETLSVSGKLGTILNLPIMGVASVLYVDGPIRPTFWAANLMFGSLIGALSSAFLFSTLMTLWLHSRKNVSCRINRATGSVVASGGFGGMAVSGAVSAVSACSTCVGLASTTVIAALGASTLSFLGASYSILVSVITVAFVSAFIVYMGRKSATVVHSGGYANRGASTIKAVFYFALFALSSAAIIMIMGLYLPYHLALSASSIYEPSLFNPNTIVPLTFFAFLFVGLGALETSRTRK